MVRRIDAFLCCRVIDWCVMSREKTKRLLLWCVQRSWQKPETEIKEAPEMSHNWIYVGVSESRLQDVALKSYGHFKEATPSLDNLRWWALGECSLTHNTWGSLWNADLLVILAEHYEQLANDFSMLWSSAKSVKHCCVTIMFSPTAFMSDWWFYTKFNLWLVECCAACDEARKILTSYLLILPNTSFCLMFECLFEAPEDSS